MRILILNGANLNLVGKRNPAIYGNKSMEQLMVEIQRQWKDVHFSYYQSNHEGDIIDQLQNGIDFDGIIINAGGYSHTSVSIRDAIEYVVEQKTPVIEVHISNIRARENFRRVSLLSDVCTRTIIGKGIDGYKEAVDYIINPH